MFRYVALALWRLTLADDSWQDTPILTSLWQATSSKDNDAIDRQLFSHDFRASAYFSGYKWL